MAEEFSHINEKGKAEMVDVGSKPIQKRTAVAEGKIFLKKATINLIHKNQMKKGDVLAVAKIAGIQAAKKTSELIPLCHQINLSVVNVETEILDNAVKVQVTAKCNGETGVEMEALVGTSIALNTIYDMCKAVDKDMCISDIKLLKKTKEEF